MAEPSTLPGGQSQPTSTPATQPTSPAVVSTTPSEPAKILGKFNSQADLEKAYQEAESKITEYGTKYKDYDRYAELGPADKIQEALSWARERAAEIQAGKLGYQQAAPARQTTNQEQPWAAEDWAYRTPDQQARAMSDYIQAANQRYIDAKAAEYGQQINGLSQRDAREKTILTKAIQLAISNPGTDIGTILEQAAQLGAKPPEELLDMAFKNLTNDPKRQEADFERRVAERVAEAQQKWEASKFSDITSARKPRFGRQNVTRQDEDKNILESLAKQNIRLF